MLFNLDRYPSLTVLHSACLMHLPKRCRWWRAREDDDHENLSGARAERRRWLHNMRRIENVVFVFIHETVCDVCNANQQRPSKPEATQSPSLLLLGIYTSLHHPLLCPCVPDQTNQSQCRSGFGSDFHARCLFILCKARARAALFRGHITWTLYGDGDATTRQSACRVKWRRRVQNVKHKTEIREWRK